MGRPNDQRNFVHKRILGGVKAFVSSGFNPLAGLSGFVSAGQRGAPQRTFVRAAPGPLVQNALAPPRGFTQAGRQQPAVRIAPARAVLPRTITARPSAFSEAGKNLGRNAKFPDLIDAGRQLLGIHGNGNGNGNGCDPPLIRSPAGNCIAPTSPRGAELFESNPILGQYGAGFIAGSKLVDVATCPRNTVLGTDGICYNKKGFANKNRMWPAGRKPLLTGGEMGAISTAARAGRRLEGATKRLQRMGMMKKPAPRARAAHQHARPVAAVSVR